MAKYFNIKTLLELNVSKCQIHASIRNLRVNRGNKMKNLKLISALAVTVSSTALFVAAANPAFA
jgi:hypothetical protein